MKIRISPILGLEGFKEIITELKNKSIDLPVIGIGGIGIEDFQAILASGIHGVALASIINLDQDPVEKAKEVMKKFIL